MATTKINDPSTINPSHFYVGVREIDDNGGTRYQYYHGVTEENVLFQMCDEFAAEAINKMPAAEDLQGHLDLRAVLQRLRLSPVRAEKVSKAIREARPKNLGIFSSYLTYAEIIRAYLRLNKDERIEVIGYTPTEVTSFASVKPAAINVIYYDHESGLAIAKNGLQLIGFFQLERVDNPHPDDYEWDNGFDFEFITPAQADALRQLGHTDIVEHFEECGAVCEG